MNQQNSDGLGSALATLDTDGAVPETRLDKALDASSLLTMRINADRVRSRKRSMVKGLVDGNPPYRQSDLVQAGRADACNVNWRIAESYLNSALGAFYDVFQEAPTYAEVQTRAGTPDQKQDWSGIITEEFDRLQKADTSFDYNMQLSQYEMVLYGCGPFFFEDAWDWRCKAALCGNLLVPEFAKSNTDYWEEGWLRSTYLPSELYSFIRDEAAATAVGWDVEAVKKAIINAHPQTQEGAQYRTWEWHQQFLKNGSIWYSAQSKTISVGHVYFREFPKKGEIEGRISHKIVLESTDTGDNRFLFERIGRFANWHEVIHPMYYDHGGGGYHHSVTGMGVKFYSAMEYQNRLLCRLADDAFAPKLMFKPTSASDRKKLSIAHLGQYALLPSGVEMMQTPIQGLMQDGMVFNREIGGQIASNLSQYRQNLEQKTGNPTTAKEQEIRASEQSRLGKTQLNRYFAQMDELYLEKYRRASNPNLTDSAPGGREALEFQKRCEDRGVPRSALQKVEFVRASRIVGQGSAYMRQESLQFMLGMISMLPENGRANVIKDVIASRTGQTFVDRYYPSATASQLPTDQESEAQDKVVGMKVGMPPTVTATQNPVIYAQTYLQAAAQSVASLQQGADPKAVAGFLEVCGPAAVAQIQRMAQDPTRKEVYKVLMDQWKKLTGIHDQLVAKLQAQAKQQAQQQAPANLKETITAKYGELPEDVKRQVEASWGLRPSQVGADTATQLKAGKIQGDHQIKVAKLQLDAEKTRANIAIQDAKTASDIRKNHAEAVATE